MKGDRVGEVDHLQQSLGHQIRDLRNGRGWSQEEFAERCRLHRTYMGRVERGQKNVTLSTIVRIASALGVGLAELFSTAEARLGRIRTGGNSRRPMREPNPHGVKNLLDQLRIDRAALREAVRALNQLLAISRAPGRHA